MIVCEICGKKYGPPYRNMVWCPTCCDKYRHAPKCKAFAWEHRVQCRYPEEVPHTVHVAGHSGHCTHHWTIEEFTEDAYNLILKFTVRSYPPFAAWDYKDLDRLGDKYGLHGLLVSRIRREKLPYAEAKRLADKHDYRDWEPEAEK